MKIEQTIVSDNVVLSIGKEPTIIASKLINSIESLEGFQCYYQEKLVLSIID